jgi:purine-binding chemotaxis protein CheW
MQSASSNKAADSGGDGQYLSFNLGGEDYGLDILKVQEIRGWETVRPLPDTPDYIKGVLDLRGAIVPIVDLRIRFKSGQAEYLPTTVIIVVATDLGERRQVMGIVVDGVSDVLDVAGDALRPAPNLGARISTRFIRGMVTREANMVVLLDMDKLLDPEELNIPEELF